MYVVPSLADFRAQFDELPVGVYSDAKVNLWLGQAPPFFDYSRWDDLLFLGMLYWVAHQLVVTKSNAGAPLIDDGITKKVGDISKTRDATLMNKGADNPYYRTVYGQQFLAYRDMVGSSGGLAV